MQQVRASRLNDQEKRKTKGWLDQKLPPGTLQRKVALWAGVPLVALLFSYLLIDNVIMTIITRQGTEFPLPDFTGKQVDQAELDLEELDLNHTVASHEYAPGQEKGVIISQFPIAGTKVKRDRTIKFVISLGEKYVAIPYMAGKSVRQAMLDLETAGLILGEIAWAFSDTLPERVVVFSYPASEMQVPLGSTVNLMVNRGRASDFTFMPNVLGMTLTDATKQLEEKSLKVGIINHRTDENYLPETVLEQSEPSGAELDIGTEIDLVVSSTE